MTNAVPKLSNKQIVTIALKPMLKEVPDNKEQVSSIPKIPVKAIASYLREYEKRITTHPHLKGKDSSIKVVQNICARYQDPDDILTDLDFDLFIITCQINHERPPPFGAEKIHHWFFKQICIDLDLEKYVRSSGYFQ